MRDVCNNVCDVKTVIINSITITNMILVRKRQKMLLLLILLTAENCGDQQR